MNILDEVLPYRLSIEQVQKTLDLANTELKNCTSELRYANPNGYIEYPEGTRYAIQTFYGEKIYDLKKLETAIIDFTGKLISRLDREKPLYIREEVSIHYVSPCHIDTNTWEYMSVPTRGYWIPYCRIRQPGHEIRVIETSEIKRQII